MFAGETLEVCEIQRCDTRTHTRTHTHVPTKSRFPFTCSDHHHHHSFTHRSVCSARLRTVRCLYVGCVLSISPNKPSVSGTFNSSGSLSVYGTFCGASCVSEGAWVCVDVGVWGCWVGTAVAVCVGGPACVAVLFGTQAGWLAAAVCELGCAAACVLLVAAGGLRGGLSCNRRCLCVSVEGRAANTTPASSSLHAQ